MFRKLFMLSIFRSPLSRFQWYRKWHAGRWELWYSVECMSEVWLLVDPYYPLIYNPWGCSDFIKREIYSYGRLLDPKEWEKYQSDAELRKLIKENTKVAKHL